MDQIKTFFVNMGATNVHSKSLGTRTYPEIGQKHNNRSSICNDIHYNILDWNCIWFNWAHHVITVRKDPKAVFQF